MRRDEPQTPEKSLEKRFIRIRGAREHTLKDLALDRRDDDRDPRLPAPPLRALRRGALPGVRAAATARDSGGGRGLAPLAPGEPPIPPARAARAAAGVGGESRRGREERREREGP